MSIQVALFASLASATAFLIHEPSARGQCSNGQGRDNAQAEGECIICSRPLLHCPSALTKPVMHTKLVSKQFSATHLPETTVGL